MKSEPLWCDVRQHYCTCQDWGKRCDDFDDEPDEKLTDDSKEKSDVPA
jgi:hypothetical protein